MLKQLQIMLLSAFAVSISGCGGGGDFPTASVTGTVTCEGVPVKGAMVYFEPIKQGEQALVGKQGFSYTDENGKYSISTYDPGGEDGAVIGKHRVRVGRGESDCNCYMNEEVNLTEVEVKKGEDNVFDLQLQKATRNQPKPLADDDDEDED